MELRGTGVDVIRVAPSSTRSGFFDAAAMLDTRAVRFAETQYPPERVARAVVRASRRRRREVTLSAEGIAISVIRRFSHRLADAIMYHVARSSMPAADGP
jgi:short-subunit dehydrogenase